MENKCTQLTEISNFVALCFAVVYSAVYSYKLSTKHTTIPLPFCKYFYVPKCIIQKNGLPLLNSHKNQIIHFNKFCMFTLLNPFSNGRNICGMTACLMYIFCDENYVPNGK